MVAFGGWVDSSPPVSKGEEYYPFGEIWDGEDLSPEKSCSGRFGPDQDLLKYIFRQITLYSRSFRWEFQGSETEENKAALISAVGWCSGWRPLLPILGMKK